jgi:NADH dehydrogenase
VIVGGGFAGLQAALKLTRRSHDVDVTMVDRRNFHLFQPLAYQVATGALSPSEICYPLRTIFREREHVSVLLAEAIGFDLAGKRVQLQSVSADDASPSSIDYDSLIVAGGSRYSYFGHDEWRASAPELKSLEGALEIRSRILSALEAAEWEGDAERRRAWLTFVVVGAGPTGVEMAGQIAELARDSAEEYPRRGSAPARVLLIEAADRVLTGFPASLSAGASRSLEHLGVTPLLENSVTSIDEETVTTKGADGSLTSHPARTVIWAAGVVPSALARLLAESAGAEVDHAGRLIVEEDLSLRGHPEISALGDMVAVRRGDHVETLPGLAPVAMQQGRQAARNVLARIAGERPSRFRYRDKGNLATIGRARAVADIKGIHLSGTIAWLTWLGVHLWYLVGFENRILVLTRWGFKFFAHGRAARLISAPEWSADRGASETAEAQER